MKLKTEKDPSTFIKGAGVGVTQKTETEKEKSKKSKKRMQLNIYLTDEELEKIDGARTKAAGYFGEEPPRAAFIRRMIAAGIKAEGLD